MGQFPKHWCPYCLQQWDTQFLCARRLCGVAQPSRKARVRRCKRNPLKSSKINQKRKNKPHKWNPHSKRKRKRPKGRRSAGTRTVHVCGGETENVTDKNRFFFFFKNIKTPAGVFYLKTNSTVFTKRENRRKRNKINTSYLQDFRELSTRFPGIHAN